MAKWLPTTTVGFSGTVDWDLKVVGLEEAEGEQDPSWQIQWIEISKLLVWRRLNTEGLGAPEPDGPVFKVAHLGGWGLRN